MTTAESLNHLNGNVTLALAAEPAAPGIPIPQCYFDSHQILLSTERHNKGLKFRLGLAKIQIALHTENTLRPEKLRVQPKRYNIYANKERTI